MNFIKENRPKCLPVFSPALPLWVIGSLTLVLSAACSLNNAAYMQAKSNYDTASRDTTVMNAAPVQMQEAQKNLNLAAKETNDANQTHYSYLATKHVEIAAIETARKTAESDLNDQRSSRNEGLLSARTQEVDDANKATKMANQRLVNSEDRAIDSKIDANEARASENKMSVANKELNREIAELQTRETDRGQQLTLAGSSFEITKPELKAGAGQKLDSVVQKLRDNPTQEAIIEGYTDNVGTKDANIELSQKRADSVSRYITDQGIDSSRIIARGYGESFPSVSNDTSAGRQQNRRVDIVLLNKGLTAKESLRQ